MDTGRVSALLVVVLLAGACSSDGGGDESRAAAGGVKRSSSSSSTSSSSSSMATTTTSATTAATSPRAPAPPPASTAKPKPTSPPPPPLTTPASLDLTGYTVVGPAPSDPAALGQMVDELVATETALRNTTTPPGEMAGLARRQQIIYRAISARPEVLPQVKERLPEGFRPVAEANVTAGAELRALTGKPRTSLPPQWRIIAPPPAEELEGYYREAETRYGVPWAYLAAVHLVETRMGRIRGTSSAGAQGPMQFMPPTWDAYGEGGDINDPRDAILAAGRYLQRNGAPGDMAKALWNYNHSDRYVRAVTLYAQQIEANHRAYETYYHWQVFYITTQGDVLLEVGYSS